MSAAELLERHPLLARMRLDQVERIAQAGTLEQFVVKEEIVREGSLGDALYLVLTGSVGVSKNGQALAQLASGEFFGEMALIEPAPRSASVHALEPTFVFRLPYTALQSLLEDDGVAFNAVLVQIVKTLSDRLRKANELVTSVGHLADWLAGSLV
ncbi:MAG TPA: cyclic nucleotide-binding domain-containing protein [Kofleriaceae bacterium]|nr:cyclic nucleotide-binding domain-containing protein [Kofleriaceae bacterium]